MWLFSQCLTGAERPVSVSAWATPIFCWSFSARKMQSREAPALSHGGHSRILAWLALVLTLEQVLWSSHQGREEGRVPHGIPFAIPDLSSIYSIFSPLGSYRASEMHHCHHHDLAGSAFWGWGTAATGPVCWCQVLRYILLPNNFLFPTACVSSREILVVQALSEDEYSPCVLLSCPNL